MNKYVELPIDQIELDKSNPRIANFLATHDKEDITSDLMALLCIGKNAIGRNYE